jgi:hypothetical protein
MNVSDLITASYREGREGAKIAKLFAFYPANT